MAYNGNYSNNGRNNNKNSGNRNNYKANHTNGNGFSKKNDDNKNSYVGAPYNFVSFNNKVIEIESDKMPVHDKLSDKLVTGEIEYTVTAKTDIIVDGGNGKFHKDARGRYSIPGSTMRGLIRNNVQILGLSSFDDDIDDYRLMYRNVANGAEKEFYNNVLGAKPISISPGSKPVGVLTNVRGGYIVKKNSRYYIYKTTVDKLAPNLNLMNYYVLSERNVVENRKSYPYLEKHPEVMQHNIQKNFKKEEFNGRVQYRGEKNSTYIPGYYKVSYEVSNIKNVSKLGEPGQFSKNGYLVATGPMNDKKVLYVIPEIDLTKDPIEVSDTDIKSFKIDFENKKNTLKRIKNVDYFNLPTKNNVFKPVFYVELWGKLYFGFTPRIRLFYEHSVKEGYIQNKCDFDYSKSIFGCINEKTGFKSKVSFSDAVVCSDYELAGGVSPVLAEPKPTSYLDYIQQGDGIATYNTSGFKLRGVKQYWLHNRLQPIEKAENAKITSSFIPLKAGAKFVGKVRFQNLTKDELGLLAWSIILNENSWMNVGKAKAYGFGVIAISDVKVSTIDLTKMYSLDVDLTSNPMSEANVTELIKSYKEYVNAKLGNHKIDDLQSIKDFFAMKDSICIPDNSQTRYMRLGDRNTPKEYQMRMNRKKTLDGVMEVIRNNN